MKTPKQSFKQLQDTWYAKLKKSGFEDIEQDDDNLKFWSSAFYLRRLSPEQMKALQDYYQMATNFLEEYKFDSKRDQIIWEYHSKGFNDPEIAKLLKKVKIKLTGMGVRYIVKKYKMKMYDMYVANQQEYHE